MTLRSLLFTSLVLSPCAAVASVPDLDRYSNAELWELADLVAVVRIEEGRYIEDRGFDLVGSTVVALKGDGKTRFSIEVRFPSLGSPNELGNTYLLYLTNNSANSYNLINENHASVLVSVQDLEFENSLRAGPSSEDLRRLSWYVLGQNTYVLTCPLERNDPNWCDGARGAFEFAFSQVSARRGEAMDDSRDGNNQADGA